MSEENTKLLEVAVSDQRYGFEIKAVLVEDLGVPLKTECLEPF